jgi:hypothetical protein
VSTTGRIHDTATPTAAQDTAARTHDPAYLAMLAEGRRRALEARDARIAADEAAPFRVEETVARVTYGPTNRRVPTWTVTAVERDELARWVVTAVRDGDPFRQPRDFFDHELTRATP